MSENEIIRYYNNISNGIEAYRKFLQHELPGVWIGPAMADDPMDYSVKIIYDDKRYVYKISDYADILEPKHFLSFIFISSINGIMADSDTIYDADILKRDIIYKMCNINSIKDGCFIYTHPDNIDICGIPCFFKIVGEHMHYFPITAEFADFLETNGCKIQACMFEAAMNDASNNVYIRDFNSIGGINTMFDTDNSCMFVTARKGTSGSFFSSSCILSHDFLRRTYKKLDGGFYILPSSIHELIIVPDDYSEQNMDNLLRIVEEINRMDVVNENGFLADSVYYFNGNALTYKTKN